MRLKLFSFIISVFLFASCQQDTVVLSKGKVPSVTTQTNISTNSFQPYFKEDSDVAAIQRIKQAFDKGLKGNSNRDLPYLYKDHSLRMRQDYFNKFPYTLNYPYNGKFDLSSVESAASQLSFLTKKCGFQKENNEVVHYYCFNDKSPFMDLLETLGKDNALIASLHKDYIRQKQISQQVREQLLMSSNEDLDFQKEEHQLIYMFYQILVNEERLAAEKIK